MAKKTSKKTTGKSKTTSKKTARKARPRPATAPMPRAGAAIPVTAAVVALVHRYIADVDTPLGRKAVTAPERSQTRLYCEAEWEALGIRRINRVEEGDRFGWELTIY